MKKIFFTILLSVFYLGSFAQQDYFLCDTITDNDSFLFPIFSNAKNVDVVEKINQMLQLSELELLKGYEEKNIFERVSINNGGIYGGKISMSTQIYTNTNKILSVGFNESSCGATCTYWVRYYNFNSGNGDMIQLKDLFTEEGFQTFYKYATQKRIDFFEIDESDDLRKEYFSDILGCYETDDWTDFYITDNKIYIDGDNCFGKNQKFDGIETVYKFDLSEFKDYLNNYGKSIFSVTEESPEKYRSYTLPQLFSGKIGKEDVLMVLNNTYEDKMRAEYVYTKYGKGIFLEGKLNGTNLTLTEKDSDYNDQGCIEAKFENDQIVGQWTGKSKKKVYDLFLNRK